MQGDHTRRQAGAIHLTNHTCFAGNSSKLTCDVSMCAMNKQLSPNEQQMKKAKNTLIKSLGGVFEGPGGGPGEGPGGGPGRGPGGGPGGKTLIG